MTYFSLGLNVTSSEYEDDYNYTQTEPELVSLPTKVTVSALMFLVCLASVVNNILTLHVFSRYRKPLTPTTACVVSLALSDLIMTMTIGPLEISVLVMDMQWVLGRSYCIVGSFFQLLAVLASCATLSCIAIDRHCCVVRPLTPRLKPRCVGFVIGGIWLVAIILSVPSLFMYKYLEHEYNDVDGLVIKKTYCLSSEKFPGTERRKYFLCIFLIGFLPLLLLITCVYAHLAHFLWIRKSVGNASEVGTVPQVRRKKRIVKTLVLLTVMYIGCRVPIHIYSTVREFVAMSRAPVQQVVRLLLVTLNLANAAANPLLYSLFHEQLRRLLVMPCKRIRHAINPKGRVIGVWTSSGNGLDSRTCQSPKARRVQFRLAPRLHEGSNIT